MIPATETAAVPSAETFGLPPEVPHLIAKLRLVPPEILAQITQPKQAAA